MRARFRIVTVMLAAAAAGLGAVPASAGAAAGDLTFSGCIGGLVGCVGVNPAGATGGAARIAFSPDGGQLYLGAHFGGVLDRFALGGGPLQTLAGCIGVTSGCTATSPSGALGGARGVAVSRDGRQLYVASYAGTVSHFTVSAGIPSYVGCIGNLAGCTVPSPADALRETGDVALSPDGAHLYATGPANGTLDWFTLDASGDPTFAGCLGDFAGCAAPSVATALTGAEGLAISPDGSALYTADGGNTAMGQTVSHFSLGPAGAPSFVGCVGKVAGCVGTAPADALFVAHQLALTPDGRHLYASTNTNVVHFDVDAAGNPVFVDCAGDPGCTVAMPRGLISGGFGIGVTPDGRALYATTYLGNAVAHFTLDAAGEPTFANCVGAFADCVPVTPADALDGAFGVAASPDGTRLFVAGYNANVLDQLAIEQAPPPASPPAPPPAPGGGGSAAGADLVPPALTAYAVEPARFAAAGRGASLARRARPHVGATIRYALSEAATVAFAVERLTDGRRVRGRCAKATRGNRRAPRCTRATTLAGSIAHASPAGASRLAFSGRWRGRALPAGRYRLVASARDGAGNAAPARRAAFRIVRLRR